MSREVGLPAVLAYEGRQLPTPVGGPRRIQPRRLAGPPLCKSGPLGIPGLHPRHVKFKFFLQKFKAVAVCLFVGVCWQELA